ncbi:hypothetical protein MBLNU13_g09719t1 [Cladosporium sp. NU13]
MTFFHRYACVFATALPHVELIPDASQSPQPGSPAPSPLTMEPATHHRVNSSRPAQAYEDLSPDHLRLLRGVQERKSQQRRARRAPLFRGHYLRDLKEALPQRQVQCCRRHRIGKTLHFEILDDPDFATNSRLMFTVDYNSVAAANYTALHYFAVNSRLMLTVNHNSVADATGAVLITTPVDGLILPNGTAEHIKFQPVGRCLAPFVPAATMADDGHNKDPKGNSVFFFRMNKVAKAWSKKYRTEIAASTSSVPSTFVAFPLDFAKSRMQSYNTTFTATVKDAYKAEVLHPLRLHSYGFTQKRHNSVIAQAFANQGLTYNCAAAAHAGPMAEGSWLPQDANFHLPYLEQQDTWWWQQQNHTSQGPRQYPQQPAHTRGNVNLAVQTQTLQAEATTRGILATLVTPVLRSVIVLLRRKISEPRKPMSVTTGSSSVGSPSACRPSGLIAPGKSFSGVFGGVTGVAFLGDGSAPQRGVGVKQSGGWLRWIRMVCVLEARG